MTSRPSHLCLVKNLNDRETPRLSVTDNLFCFILLGSYTLIEKRKQTSSITSFPILFRVVTIRRRRKTKYVKGRITRPWMDLERRLAGDSR